MNLIFLEHRLDDVKLFNLVRFHLRDLSEIPCVNVLILWWLEILEIVLVALGHQALNSRLYAHFAILCSHFANFFLI